MQIIQYFIFLVILFAPTFIANGVPVVVKNIPFISKFNKPINERIFWKNKTYRWFIFWVFIAIIFSLLEYKFLSKTWIKFITVEYYRTVTSYSLAVLVWFLQWFWALFWDIVESFFKRKIWKKPWEAWFFWDWVDYILASILLFSFIYIPSIWWIIFLIILSPIISLFSNTISYLLWLKNVRY